jgi:hypothetical protein
MRLEFFIDFSSRLQQDGLSSRRSSCNGRRRSPSASPGGNGAAANCPDEVPDAQASHTNVHEDVSVRITPAWVVFFVFCMCTMLVLLYFFFNQLGKVYTVDRSGLPDFLHAPLFQST